LKFPSLNTAREIARFNEAISGEALEGDRKCFRAQESFFFDNRAHVLDL
jgi:hypothetical protein